MEVAYLMAQLVASQSAITQQLRDGIKDEEHALMTAKLIHSQGQFIEQLSYYSAVYRGFHDREMAEAQARSAEVTVDAFTQ